VTTLILEPAGYTPIEQIIQTLQSIKFKATLHWSETARRIVIPVDGKIDVAVRPGLIRAVAEVFETYFDLQWRTDPSPLPDGETREFDGQICSAELLTSLASKTKTDDEEKGPQVPSGINLLGIVGVAEVGDVRACPPTGFVQTYLNDTSPGLERLAGVVGQVVVRQNDGYWVRTGDSWSPTTQGAAIGKVKSEWRAVLATHGVRCTHRHIEELFRRSLLPVIDGTLTSPVESDFVTYQGRTYLNRRLAPRLEPTTFGADGDLIRAFVLSNVLNDHRSPAEIEEELANGKAITPTRWALNWIAHQYQRPGLSLSTALWLISTEQGVGKSLFASMLGELVGPQNAVRADQSEMASEWSDWINGYSLIIADEINVIEKKSFYAKQKSWIGSRSISIRRRGIGSWMIPTIANWLFLTNDLTPIRIDAADRRNMLIRSTNDLDRANEMIERIKPILRDAKRYRSALAEFGAWLDSIKVDDGLIARAIPTDLKDDLIENTRDPVDSFIIEQVETNAWKPGQWLPTDGLMRRYSTWCEKTDVFKGWRSQSHLVKELKRLKDRGWVEPCRRNQGRGWTLTSPPCSELPQAEKAHKVVDLPCSSLQKPGAMLERMRINEMGRRTA